MDKLAFKLQARLVQTCIDFILVLFPIIFITHLILDIKYTGDSALRDFIFDIAIWCNLFCWVCIAGGMLLVYLF